MPVARRSTSIKVLAALNLAGGFIGLFGSLMGLVTLLTGNSGGMFGGGPGVPPEFNAQALEAHLTTTAPGYRVYQIGGIAVSLLFDIMLIASGFGLLAFKKWARFVAITYAWMTMVKKVAVTAYICLALAPATSSFIDKTVPAPPPGQPDAVRIGALGVLYLVACVEFLFIAYPIIVLSILLSKSGKAAFEPLPPEEDYDDEDDEDDRRERFDDRDRPERPKRDDDRYGERDDRGGRR